MPAQGVLIPEMLSWATLMATHDPAAAAFATHVYHLQDGALDHETIEA